MVAPELPSLQRPGSMAPTARQIDSIEAMGMSVQTLEMKGRRIFKYLQVLPLLHGLSRSVDIVHAHFGFCGWIARSQKRAPVVISFMGDDLLGTPKENGQLEYLSQVFVQINRRFAKHMDSVIVKSAEMASVIAPIEAHIIPNGVDLDRFRPSSRQAARTKLGWKPAETYVLFPGNPANPRKGFSLAREIIDHAAKRLGYRPILVPLWGVSPDQVPTYMNACNAMLMTSLVEGSPNVVKEAMACNLPIASVSVGDVPELFEGIIGYEIRPRRPQRLADALYDVLNTISDVDGRKAIKEKGLDKVNVAKRVIKVYESVLASSS